jgi:hypothetical protein
MLVLLVAIIVCSSAGAEQFRFTASADNRPYDAANLARWEWMLDEMADKVGNEGVFHIMPGDFDSPEITDASLMTQFGIGTIWYPVVGNHEAETAADMTWVRNAFSGLPYIVKSGPSGCGDTTYSFDYGNAHFVAINEYYDGTSDTGTDGDVVTELYNWLVDDLNNNTKPVVFVIGHEPAYPQGAHVGDSLDGHTTNRDRFWKLLNDRKVIAYICGHTHYYSALQQAQTGTYPCDAFTWQVDCGNAGNPRELEQTFVDVTVTDTEVIFNTWQGLEGNTYTITDAWTVQIPAPIVEAHNPSPADGATQVAVDADLEWTAGAGAVSHDVYFGTTDPPPSIQNQTETIYDPGTLEYETTYYWRIDEVGPGGTVTGNVWSFITQPDHFDDLANSDIPVKGTIAGNYTDTQSSNDVNEAITERESGGKPSNRYSYLEHKWTINVTGGDTVIFNLEAYKTDSVDEDDFVFAYSTDDDNYTEMVTVTELSETVQSYQLPGSISGTVYIRVTDTDQTQGNKSLDTIYIDHMYIRSEGTGTPDTEPPTPDPMTWATEPYATGSTSISMTATTASDPSGVEYYFACTLGSGHDSGWQDSPTYEDTGLIPDRTYTYWVKARDKSAAQNTTGWSGEASAITDPQVEDVVIITKAEYKVAKSELNVEAMSIFGGTDVLQVWNGNGNIWYGEMTYDSRKDIYRLKKGSVDEPGVEVMVTSDLGGLDTMIVTYK